MMRKLRAFWRSESGQGMSEYGIVVAIVVFGAVVGLTAFKDNIVAFFKDLGQDLQGKSPS